METVFLITSNHQLMVKVYRVYICMYLWSTLDSRKLRYLTELFRGQQNLYIPQRVQPHYEAIK